MCNTDHVIASGQVDHIIPAGSLRKTEDIQGFVERLLYVAEEDLRLICKGCNSALAYADKQGVTYEQAIKEKMLIEICKSKKDIQFLKDRGIIPASNAVKRKEQIREFLNNEN